jgi:methylated-DNA-[protein]-cysteine S-methyltransferase
MNTTTLAPDVPVHVAFTASPVGTIRLLAAGGALVGLHLDGRRDDRWLPADGFLDGVAGQLQEYFAGTRTTFDLPVHLMGTPFQVQVWSALADIPYGSTASYGEIARRVGRPGSARAVGAANGQNPVSIVVPCHRVIGAGGALTGYGWGVERKAWLLDHEQGRSGWSAVVPT